MSSIIKVDTLQTAAGGVPTAADLGINTTGSVLQVVQEYVASTGGVATTSTAFAPSGIIASLTPKFSNSLILVNFSSTMGDVTSASMMMVKMYQKIGTGSYLPMSGSNNYHVGYMEPSHNRYGPFAFNGSYTATSTDTLSYQVYFLSGSSGVSVRVAHPSSSYALTLTEIAG